MKYFKVPNIKASKKSKKQLHAMKILTHIFCTGFSHYISHSFTMFWCCINISDIIFKHIINI